MALALEFPDQTPQQNAKTVEQVVGSLLIQAASDREKLRAIKAMWHSRTMDTEKMTSILSTVDPPGSENDGNIENLRELIYACFDRSGGEPTSYG